MSPASDTEPDTCNLLFSIVPIAGVASETVYVVESLLTITSPDESTANLPLALSSYTTKLLSVTKYALPDASPANLKSVLVSPKSISLLVAANGLLPIVASCLTLSGEVGFKRPTPT